jgi:hypothetical protein
VRLSVVEMKRSAVKGEKMEAKEINKEIARIIYGKDIVIDDEHGLIASSQTMLDNTLKNRWLKTEISPDGSIKFCKEIPYYFGNEKEAIFLLNEMAKKCDINIINNCGCISGMLGWSVSFKKDNEWKSFKDENIGKAICLAFIEFGKDKN